MGLFKKKKEERTYEPPKRSLVQFIQLRSAEDAVLTKIGKDIKKGIPVILNFQHLSIDEANKSIAFLSGVVYCLDGVILQFDSHKGILFADSHVYSDGSMKELIREIQGD